MNHKDACQQFVLYAAKALKLKALPSRVIIIHNKQFVQEHRSFGGYDSNSTEIFVYAGDRHPVDVIRTLAHELVHHKQRELGFGMDGSDGSVIENQANAVAGLMLRQYRIQNPSLYEDVG